MTRRAAPEEYASVGDLFDEKRIAAAASVTAELDDRSIRAAFDRFHADNPHVWTLFEKFALEAIARGRGKFGAKAIFERLRWYSIVETDGEPWRLNNNYTAYYARLFESRHPEHAGFFEMREVGS